MKCSLAQLVPLFKMNMNEMNANASQIQEPVKRSSYSYHVSMEAKKYSSYERMSGKK